MVIGLLAGLAAAILFGVAAVVQAHAVRSPDAPTETLPAFVTSAIRNPLILLVVAAYLGGFALHAVAIWLLPLYLAQASIAFSLPVTALAAGRVNDHLSRRQWLAVLAVMVGLVLLALGSGAPGAVRISAVFVGCLVGGLVLILAAVSTGLVGGGLGFGTLSGLAYAGSAIAVRGVTWSTDPLVILGALCVSSYGLLGFWLYSSGLERSDVSSATAPLVVGQTAVPAVLGLLFLGDQIRPGWSPSVVAGLVLAMTGAILVSRTSSGRVSASAADPAG